MDDIIQSYVFYFFMIKTQKNGQGIVVSINREIKELDQGIIPIRQLHPYQNEIKFN